MRSVRWPVYMSASGVHWETPVASCISIAWSMIWQVRSGTIASTAWTHTRPLTPTSNATARRFNRRRPSQASTTTAACSTSTRETPTTTGGTPEELLQDAKRVSVDIVFLSDHYRPPRDFMGSWRGPHDGVLLIPGSAAHGFLIHSEASVVEYMGADVGTLLREVNRGAGMAFLSHVEERDEHSMDGLTSMEIYTSSLGSSRQ